MGYALLADLIVVVHLIVVTFVVGGLLVILVGATRRWAWVCNPCFRIAHLATIVLVALQATLGVACPLTSWEYALRHRAGQLVETDISFVGRLVRGVIFYEAPPWAFTVCYVLFALLVIAALFIVPPTWSGPHRRRTGSNPYGSPRG
jgi:hypothetical protein